MNNNTQTTISKKTIIITLIVTIILLISAVGLFSYAIYTDLNNHEKLKNKKTEETTLYTISLAPTPYEPNTVTIKNDNGSTYMTFARGVDYDIYVYDIDDTKISKRIDDKHASISINPEIGYYIEKNLYDRDHKEYTSNTIIKNLTINFKSTKIDGKAPVINYEVDITRIEKESNNVNIYLPKNTKTTSELKTDGNVLCKIKKK